MHLTWPLTGRSTEMRAVAAALSAPDVGGVVIRGAAGVGKSRIAREALAAAAAGGHETRWTVGASSARSIPLGAFTAWAPLGAVDSVQLVRGVVEALTACPPGRDVVIGVDDAHLLDDLSTFVVHQIVSRGAAKVILTVRDDTPLSPALQEISTVGRLDRLDLGALPADETTTLLAAALGGSVAPDAAERLWKLTPGNPLYLRNIVEQEIDDGRIARERDCWRWSGDPQLPPGLAELIESRIGDLPAGVADVIDVLAVGEPIELATLSRITDAAAVEEADVRGLISLEAAGGGIEVRVAHPLYGEVRRRRAAPTRLRRLRGLVAGQLAESDDGDDPRVVVRRAALSLDSDLPPDADLLVRAAHGAVWLADLALADRLAEAAVRAGGGGEPSLIRAHALSWLGHGEESEAVFAGIPAAALTDEQRARLAFLRSSNLLWALGDPVHAKATIDEAARIAPPGARTYIDAFLTVYWFAMDEPEAAVRASKDLVLSDIPVVGAEISWALTQIAADAGRMSDAVALAEEGYEIATRTLDAPHMRFNIADAHVAALVLAGCLAEASEVADRIRAQADDLPGGAALLGAAIGGRAALGAGDLPSACRLLDTAVAGLSASHAGGWGFSYRVAHATALAMRGSSDEAQAQLGALERIGRPFRQLDFEHGVARAWLAASQGAVSEATALVLSAAQKARAAGRFAQEVVCLQTAVQFGDPSGAARLTELESIVDGPRVAAAARFAAALRAGNAAAMSSVSEEFERIGDLVAAVDAAAHAAIAHRRHDRRGSALSCSTRADTLATQCGAATPALRQATEALPFTDRETEIVMLIGEGLSNRAIADRLTLSVRTVESYVYRAMSKTGTTSRDELAALMPRRRGR